jgi:5'-nucleotidase
MRVLLTNDDGFDAPGIKALYEVFKNSTDVKELIVAAPEKQQSCTGVTLTLHKPLRLTEVADHYFKVNGSPADCVSLVCGFVKKNNIDLVVSGVNEGPNLGNDVAYSGTVSAAIHATNMGIQSIAVSLGKWNPQSQYFKFAAETALLWAKKIHKNKLPDQTFLNINVPEPLRNSDGSIKTPNTRITKLGKRSYSIELEERTDPRNKRYYWNCGKPIGHCEQKDTDCSAIDDGFIAITPVQLDYTNYDALKLVSDWL